MTEKEEKSVGANSKDEDLKTFDMYRLFSRWDFLLLLIFVLLIIVFTLLIMLSGETVAVTASGVPYKSDTDITAL